MMEPRREHWWGNEGGSLLNWWVWGAWWGCGPCGKTFWHRHHHHRGWEAQWVAKKGGVNLQPRNNMARKVGISTRATKYLTMEPFWGCLGSPQYRAVGGGLEGKWLAEWFSKTCTQTKFLLVVPPLSTNFMARHLNWLMSCFWGKWSTKYMLDQGRISLASSSSSSSSSTVASSSPSSSSSGQSEVAMGKEPAARTDP